MKRTQDIIAMAATTGKSDSGIGIVTCNTSGIRSTWKLDGKQITFKKLYGQLESREG